MATVVDSLVIELGLDPSKFTAGQRQALDSMRKFEQEAVRGGKEVEGAGKRIDQFFGTIKRGALGALTAFGIGVGLKEMNEFINKITVADANVGRFARTMNISGRELSAWQGVAKQTGS